MKETKEEIKNNPAKPKPLKKLKPVQQKNTAKTPEPVKKAPEKKRIVIGELPDYDAWEENTNEIIPEEEEQEETKPEPEKKEQAGKPEKKGFFSRVRDLMYISAEDEEDEEDDEEEDKETEIPDEDESDGMSFTVDELTEDIPDTMDIINEVLAESKNKTPEPEPKPQQSQPKNNSSKNKNKNKKSGTENSAKPEKKQEEVKPEPETKEPEPETKEPEPEAKEPEKAPEPKPQPQKNNNGKNRKKKNKNKNRNSGGGNSVKPEQPEKKQEEIKSEPEEKEPEPEVTPEPIAEPEPETIPEQEEIPEDEAMEEESEEDISVTEETEKPEKSDGTAFMIKNGKYGIPVLLCIVLAIIGVIAIINTLISGGSSDDKYKNAVYPAVITDISPFEDPSGLSDNQILSSAIWSVILDKEKLAQYPQRIDNMAIIPAEDIQNVAREMFGEDLRELTHSTITTADSKFYYNEEAGSYSVDIKPYTFTYSPEITSVSKKKGKYIVEVDYIAEHPEWMEEGVSKSAEFILSKNDNGGYTIESMREVTPE